jgi:hypothetical protein
MPAVRATFRSQTHQGHRKESKALVVAISVLQLAFVVLVWLLALIPVALMALGATVFQAVKPKAATVPTPVDS